MNSVALTLASLAMFLSAGSDISCTREDAVLYSIMIVESSGRPCLFHPDSRSYGLFGLTKAACDEVGVPFPPKDELGTARKYLRLMADRHCSDRIGDDRLYTAAGWYHGGGAKRRNAYAARLLKYDPADFDGSVSTFKSALLKECR